MPGKYFYPRPPRGGRRRSANARTNPSDFYPRPPRGGRLKKLYRMCDKADFYPRPPRGGRLPASPAILTPWVFLSTPSARRATQSKTREGKMQAISIHALREEGDLLPLCFQNPNVYFYPRPPRGGRPSRVWTWTGCRMISIHALREEGDVSSSGLPGKISYFYPRPPRGGRPTAPLILPTGANFYPRPPRGGRQQKQRQNLYFQTNYTTFCTNLEEP